MKIFIDGKKYECNEGENLLQICIKNNIDVPHFCYHEDQTVDANCRLCIVEYGCERRIATSCTLQPQEGMEIFTQSEQLNVLRKQNLEFMLSNHRKRCNLCRKGFYCRVYDLMKKYGVTGLKYIKPLKSNKIYKLGTAAEIDPNMCILCKRCVKSCQNIGIGFLKFENKGYKKVISTNKDPDIDCVYCGQCTLSCPVGAAREQSHLSKVLSALNDKTKVVIAQIAPSVRASIGELFGVGYGVDLTLKLNTALKKLGFDKVFDVNMGADITTVVEAEELIERIKNNGVLPMFTSCCPAWVKFLEFYYPSMIPHLTTSRSPQIHSGGIYKTWWAEKEGIDPKRIVVVSIMPCTSKKYEAGLEKFKINEIKPVDYVLTTRELGAWLKTENIDLSKLEDTPIDPVAVYSGAGAIFGASGGVMESALRTAAFFLTGENLPKIEFEQVRGYEGIKKSVIKIGDRSLKIAVVSTAKNARMILEEIKNFPHMYDYVEFMMCPGGCIGGGGQPIPTSAKIVKQRIEGLYKIDSRMKIRCAHENTLVQSIFKDYLDKIPFEKRSKLLYTDYASVSKYN